ncbi:hypothetical protein PIB30_058026 [Stylosanthes scabra]|uniref:Uncharacterized protein n=1 Tax=Stylosanthes scabra TaxID=79078 RepID=A0ABU6TL62_9FABA|nr:hypothetical protein [Stylosanthes scabra]
MVNPREECKAVSVTIVEETPVKEEKVEAKPKASFIAPSPPPLLAEGVPPSPPPKPKSSEWKSMPFSKFLEVFACLGVNMPDALASLKKDENRLLSREPRLGASHSTLRRPELLTQQQLAPIHA